MSAQALDEIASAVVLLFRQSARILQVANLEALDVTIEAGALLAQAKDQMPHGAWLPWLKARHIDKRRAQEALLLFSHEAEIRGAAFISFRRALRVASDLALAERRQAIIAKAQALPPRNDLIYSSMETFLPTRIRDLDGIITDPPYAKEYIPLYGELARLAKSALKPDGTLAVMCGNATMLDVGAAMRQHLPYVHTLSFQFDDSWRTKIWPAKMGHTWKPVLLFGTVRDWGTDTVHTGPMLESDKLYHKWGQSEEGFRQLVKRLTRPGDLVCDPFLGGGTTAIACAQLGRRFVGCDIDPDAVAISSHRLRAYYDGLTIEDAHSDGMDEELTMAEPCIGAAEMGIG